MSGHRSGCCPKVVVSVVVAVVAVGVTMVVRMGMGTGGMEGQRKKAK